MKRKIIFYSLSVLISGIIATFMYFIVSFNAKGIVLSMEDINPEYRSTLIETFNDSPENHNPYEVLASCFYKMYNTEKFEVKTGGTSSSSIGIKQEIIGNRIVDGNYAYILTESLGFLSFADQRFYIFDEQKVYKRKASSASKSGIRWDDSSVIEYTFEEILQLYGWLPKHANGYVIIKDDTILNDLEMKKLEDGKYSIYVELNPSSEKGPYWYRREIATNSNSTIEPEFKMININFIFDDKYRILRQEINEQYTILSYGFKTTATTNVYDEFTYDNVKIPDDVYGYFINK